MRKIAWEPGGAKKKSASAGGFRDGGVPAVAPGVTMRDSLENRIRVPRGPRGIDLSVGTGFDIPRFFDSLLPDMSDPHSSPPSESPLARLLNGILMLGTPLFLLAILGLTGFFFVAGMGDTEEEKAEAAAAIAAAAPASAAPPAAGGAAPAPAGAAAVAAAPAKAADGKPEGVTDAFWEMGKSSYATCAACHGPDGKGLQAGPAKMAPSMEKSPILTGDPNGAILVVLKGIAKENMDFMGIMAGLGAGLNDEQIAAVLTYCRNSFGNSAPAIKTEEVAAARAKFAAVNAPAGVKRAEIPAIIGAAK